MKGTLYIVATPIGNLEDITLRGIRILKEVDFVFAEDTRTTGNLFKKYEIQTTLISYNAHNQESKNKEILKLLNEGKSLALVSDAGTPGISDPGYSAVAYLRANLPDAKISPIPGASALTAFISSVGVGTHIWTFYGFLPHKNGRQKLLKQMVESKTSSVFYESTHRIIKCLEELNKLGDRKVMIGREISKIYEEFLTGTPEELLSVFKGKPEKTKGEFVVMVV
jgi:16S rRNA (cytidine1402-2'-O)-methyltransferase